MIGPPSAKPTATDKILVALARVQEPSGDGVLLPAPDDENTAMAHWAALYFHLVVAGRSANTERAQRRDLGHFIRWFGESFGHLRIEQWLRATTEDYVRHLRSNGKSSGRGYAVATVNRMLATLRTFASFCDQRGAFAFGHPTRGAPDLMKESEKPKALSKLEMNRLRQAARVLCEVKKGRRQYPRRDLAIFMVLWRVGLRVSELCGLSLDQYQKRGQAMWLMNIVRKGKRVDDRPVPSDARAAIEQYLELERPRHNSNSAQELFLSSGGRALTQKAVWNILERIAAQANSTLPAEEHIRVTPHQLRHTFAQEFYDHFGDVETARALGHTSLTYVSVYNKRTADEEAAMVEQLLT